MMELEGMQQTCPNHCHRRVCIISASVHSCSIPLFFVRDGVWHANLENAVKEFGLDHL